MPALNYCVSQILYFIGAKKVKKQTNEHEDIDVKW